MNINTIESGGGASLGSGASPMAPTFPQGEPQVLGPRHMLQRSEFIRLLEQALQNLGYAGLASRLEAESVGRQGFTSGGPLWVGVAVTQSEWFTH